MRWWHFIFVGQGLYFLGLLMSLFRDLTAPALFTDPYFVVGTSGLIITMIGGIYDSDKVKENAGVQNDGVSREENRLKI